MHGICVTHLTLTKHSSVELTILFRGLVIADNNNISSFLCLDVSSMPGTHSAYIVSSSSIDIA